MRISDWSSDVCSSDLGIAAGERFDELAYINAGHRFRRLGRCGCVSFGAIRGRGQGADRFGRGKGNRLICVEQMLGVTLKTMQGLSEHAEVEDREPRILPRLFHFVDEQRKRENYLQAIAAIISLRATVFLDDAWGSDA